MNIIEIRVQAVNDTAPGLEAAKASAEEAGGEAGDGFVSAFSSGLATRLAEAAGTAGAQAAAALAESVSGTGDAIGSEIGASLATGLGDAPASAGTEAGTALAQGMAEGASGIGDTIGHDVSAELTGQLSAAGEQAGQAGAQQLTSALQSGTSTVGDELAAHISAQLRRGLDEQAQTTMGVLGAAMASGTAAISITVGASLTHLLAAAATGAATGAGDAAGTALATSIADSAASTAGVGASAVGAAIEAPLSDALIQAGAAGGDALVAGIGQGVSQGAGVLAEEVGQSLQASLDTTMTQAGMAAADAFNAGFGAVEGAGGAAGGGAGGGIVAEFLAKGEPGVERAAEALGEKGATAFGTGWQTRNGFIPYGGVLEPDELLSMGKAKKQPDAFVPDLSSSTSAWVLASTVGAQDAAEAAWRAYGDELAGLVIPPADFLKLTDTGIQLWTEEVGAQAAVSGEGFVHAFADAMTMGMAGIDWSALSDAQANALGAAIRGTLTKGLASATPAAEASAAELAAATVESLQAQIASTGSGTADLLISQIVEAKQAGVEQLDAYAELLESRLHELAQVGGAAAADLVARFNAAVDEGGAQLEAYAELVRTQLSFAGGDTLGISGITPDPAAAEAFAQKVEQQLEVQLGLAAAQASLAFEQELAADIAEAETAMARQLAGLDTVEGQLDAVFESIYQHGTVMSSRLAGAMTDALAGIEADTTGFTTSELAQWNEFFTVLEARGTTAAYQLAASMGSLQNKDMVGLGLGSTGLPMAKAGSEAEGLASDLGAVEKAAAGATSGMGGMASMMYGPWGMAAFAAMSFLPMLSSMFGSASVSAATFTASIQQDSGAVGDNTAATIQQTLAKTNLSDISQQLGVSQATLIEYAAGESQAQLAVTAAYDAKQGALQQDVAAQGRQTIETLKAGDAAAAQSRQLSDQKISLDDVTASVQAAIQSQQAQSDALLAAERTTQIYRASVNALGSQMMLQAEQTRMSNQATVEYTGRLAGIANADGAFNLALQASYDKLQLSAQASSQATVGLLNLGDSQQRVNMLTYDSLVAYTEAQAGANAYAGALTALSGNVSGLLGSEATFTTSLDGLTKSIKTNGDSLDVNTTKGAANTTAIIAIANAADKAAAAVYQNEVNTVGSTKAYQDANTKLAQEKTAFENSAIAAGMNKDKVKQLADQLFQLPPNVTTTVNVDTSPAEHGLQALLSQINSSGATVTVYQNSSGQVFSSGGGGVKAQAVGGPSVGYAASGGGRSGSTLIDEQGPELVNLPNGSMVVPAANTAALMSGWGGFGGNSLKVQLEWVGGQSDAGFMEWLRGNIRIRGGGGPDSVQRALGQVG